MNASNHMECISSFVAKSIAKTSANGVHFNQISNSCIFGLMKQDYIGLYELEAFKNETNSENMIKIYYTPIMTINKCIYEFYNNRNCVLKTIYNISDLSQFELNATFLLSFTSLQFGFDSNGKPFPVFTINNSLENKGFLYTTNFPTPIQNGIYNHVGQIYWVRIKNQQAINRIKC